MVAFIYGAVFAFLPRSFIPPLLLPVAVGSLLAIWALPEGNRVPVRTMTALFLSFYVSLVVWPNYLAIAVPGLPWITLIRLFGIPLAILLLFSVSTSREFKTDLKDTLKSVPTVWKFLACFAVLQFVTVFFSTKPFFSAQKFIIAQIVWTSIFFVSCYLFRKQGFPTRWSLLFICMALVLCGIGLWEWRIQRLPWAGHIPSFLQVDDPTVQRTLAGARRAGVGEYRVQGSSSTSLGLAEILALATPFAIHVALTANWFWRAVALAALPLFLLTIINTDARLGMVGFIFSFVVYGGLWAIRSWKVRRDSILGPALVLAYPVAALVVFLATLMIGRLHVLVWGGGEHQYSTEARYTQIDMGIPLILKWPLGYGPGRAGETLGFTNPAGDLTIDNYYLSIALEYGIIGFVAYYGMFLAAIGYGLRSIVNVHEKETQFIMPAVVSLGVFVLVKSVFSQQESHPLAFMLLGLIAALVWRHKQEMPTNRATAG